MNRRDSSAANSTPAPASTKTRPSLNPEDQMGGFAKGLAVIEAYARGRSALTIAEVARLAGLDRASARRCLLTLVNAGYASTDGRYFELTPRILRLGNAYLAAPLPRLIQPSLDSLAQTLNASCSASVLDGTEIVYIARAAHHLLIAGGLHAGSRLPAYCTAMGRVLLAALPPEQSQALLMQSERRAVTARTLTNIDALVTELERVRMSGFCLIDQEVEIGSMSVAAPIRTTQGRTVAAFVVALHATPESAARIRTEILPRMLEVQRQIAEILP